MEHHTTQNDNTIQMLNKNRIKNERDDLLRVSRIIHILLKGSVLLKKYHPDFDFTDMDDC